MHGCLPPACPAAPPPRPLRPRPSRRGSAHRCTAARARPAAFAGFPLIAKCITYSSRSHPESAIDPGGAASQRPASVPCVRASVPARPVPACPSVCEPSVRTRPPGNVVYLHRPSLLTCETTTTSPSFPNTAAQATSVLHTSDFIMSTYRPSHPPSHLACPPSPLLTHL